MFTLEDGEENLQATYHPIKARTYLRKDKDVLTRNQMGTLNSDNIKGLLKSGKRLPLHDETVIGSRELTAQEKEEMQDARWGIEGDPLLRHDGGGNRSGGGQNGTGEDRDGDGGQNGDGGAKRRVNQESSSSSSSSDDDEAATPKPANNKDDESDKSSDQPTPKPSPKPSAGSDSSGSSDSDG